MSRRVIAIGTAATLGLLAIWYILLWSPQSASLQHARTNATAAQQKELTLKIQVAALQKERTQLPALQAQLRHIELAIPSKPLIDTFIDQLNAAALGSGVSVQTFSATPPVVPPPVTATTTQTTTASASSSTAAASQSASATPAAPATSIGVALGVGGSYPQLVDFINRLTSLPRLTVVDGVGFTAPAAADKLMTASITARVFEDPQFATSTKAVGAH